jgi:hypothetical protein
MYVGTLPAADNLGSFSLQPSATARFWQTLYRWDANTSTATNFDAEYNVFSAAGVATNNLSAGAAWDALVANHWYRQSTTFSFATNRITEVTITDLTTNITTTANPTDWYLAGGANSTLPMPTDFRLFTGGSAGNVMAWDNLNVVPEPATVAAVAIGLAALVRRRRR